jgi:predicted nucleic acid-binding protein
MNYGMINQVIIADSSPLISLAIIEQLELLPQLYQRVLLPPAVWEEITVQGLGLPGAEAVSQAKWLEIEAPLPMLSKQLSILVDYGEAEAISLAQSTPNSIVLLDDARARRIAERLDIPRIGTLGILRRAKKAGLIAEMQGYIEQLRNNGIYIRPSILRQCCEMLEKLIKT